jgi:hypothetical protein
VHAKHRWPKAINAHLWPYALQVANQVHMHSPTRNGQAPLDLFSQIASTSTPKYFHPFGCPVYVLTKPNGKGSKWEERSRIRINLGTLPTHACSVSLVLSIKTGLVSPQFHVKFNNMFETVPTQHLQIDGNSAPDSRSQTNWLPLSHQSQTCTYCRSKRCSKI